MSRVRLRKSHVVRFLKFFARGDDWTGYHLSVFVLTFSSCVFVHAVRKTLSTVKPSLILKWTSGDNPLFTTVQNASEFLAMLDGGFLFSYATGLFISGILGDRYNPKRVLFAGMLLSSIATFLFGYVTEVTNVHSKSIYAFLWILNGFLQSTAWPTQISIMAAWFGHGSRGVVMGAWGCCSSLGNIVGTLVSGQTVLLGYQYAFAANSGLLFVSSFIVLHSLVSSPLDVGLSGPSELLDKKALVIEEVEVRHRRQPIGFFKAWLLPGVIPYSIAYACLKLVNYGFFFWLPFYIHNNFHWSESIADELSIWFDVGTMVAAIVAGAVSDRFTSRTPVIVTMLFISSFALFAYSRSPALFFANAILLFITGFFVGGPANMISSSVSADLGKASELRGNSEALATVTGIVDGTGSTGAAIGQLLIPSIQAVFGWDYVFFFFIFMVLCTALSLFPLMIKEHRQKYIREPHPSGGGEEQSDDEAGLLLA